MDSVRNNNFITFLTTQIYWYSQTILLSDNVHEEILDTLQKFILWFALIEKYFGVLST